MNQCCLADVFIVAKLWVMVFESVPASHRERQRGGWRCFKSILKEELLCPHGVQALSGMGLGHLDTVQVNVAVGVVEMLAG